MRHRIGRPRFMQSFAASTDPFVYVETDYVVRDGSRNMLGQLTLVSPPVNPTDAASKAYVDATLSGVTTGYVAKAGDTMTGLLTLPGIAITNPLHAATKAYVDSTTSAADNLRVLKAGDNMSGFLFLHATPTQNMHAATKQYVDLLVPAISDRVLRAGDTMTGFLTLNDNPQLPLHAATRQFVEAIAATNTGAVKIADTPPAGPIQGILWWESDTGILWMYYNDGTSVQWVEVGGASAYGNFIQKTGDTMTGDLTIAPSAVSAALKVQRPSGALGISAGVNLYTANSPRWAMRLSPNSAETGGNGGGQLEFVRYGDDGLNIDAEGVAPLTIFRTSGRVSLGLGIPSTSPTTGALTVAGGLGVGGAINAAGDVTVVKSTPTINLDKSDASRAEIFGRKNGLARWSIVLGSALAETGGDIGSDFSINRYNDAGVAINAIVQITRGAGDIALNGRVLATSTLPSTSSTTGALTVFGGLGVGGAVNIGTEIGIRTTAGTAPGNVNTDVGISTASNTMFLSCANGQPININRNSDGWLMPCSRSGVLIGGLSCTSTTTIYNTSSDAALKEDLKSFDAGNIIDNTNVYDFAWKSTKERAYGVIAQQAYDVYPQAVTHTGKVGKSEAGPARDEWWGIDYSKYVPVLLQELKALRSRVKDLEDRLSQTGETRPGVH
jgi:hypothetical protein